VVIAIIGVLATLAVVALQQARQNARDSKRMADMKQVQTAMELFFNENGRYPTEEEWNSGQIISSSTGEVFMHSIPSAPTPADGGCSEASNTYSYVPSVNGDSYVVDFCTGKQVSDIPAGVKQLTPGGIVAGGSGGGVDVVLDPECTFDDVLSGPGTFCGGGIISGVLIVDDSHVQVLIAAEEDQGSLSWGCENIFAGATSVSNGKANTELILSNCGSGGAAEIASNHRGGGYSDWYLPSSDELGMFLSYIRFYNTIDYWSSTETNSLEAENIRIEYYAKNFLFVKEAKARELPTPSISSKSISKNVRAVRSVIIEGGFSGGGGDEFPE